MDGWDGWMGWMDGIGSMSSILFFHPDPDIEMDSMQRQTMEGMDSMAKILDGFHGKNIGWIPWQKSGMDSMAKMMDGFHGKNIGSIPCHPSYFSIPIPILRWIPCCGKQWLGWIPWQKYWIHSMAKILDGFHGKNLGSIPWQKSGMDSM